MAVKHIFDIIEKHPEITTLLKLPETAIYDHIKHLIEVERSVLEIKGHFHVIESPPRVLVECGFLGPTSSMCLE